MRESKTYYVYIMASRRDGTLYVGVTNDLVRRVFEHRNDVIEGFTKKYHVHVLVHYELSENAYSAMQREKNIKAWQRQWKIRLIEEANPAWEDLYPEVIGGDSGGSQNPTPGFQPSLE